MFDYIIITHLPVFYKVNLYNEMSKNLNIFVIFISSDTVEKRSSDFNSLANIDFQYHIVNQCDFQIRSVIKSCFMTLKILSRVKYKKLLVSGWDLPEFWLAILFSTKFKNCLSLESTEIESCSTGIRGLVKKLFLTRVSTVFASGTMHANLLKNLKYKDNIKITMGVGIINKHSHTRVGHHKYTRSFLFIGRLTKIKNVENLVTLFNKLEEYQLTIIGIGEQEALLKERANHNIQFLGSVKNSEIKKIIDINDFLILPSISEPWGLVVEEALHFGLPVIISKNCGSKDLIKNGINGFIFDPKNISELESILSRITAYVYSDLSSNIPGDFIECKDEIQVEQYLNV